MNWIDEKIAEKHLKWLSKTQTATINGTEMTVLPYGYLSQAVREALQEAHQRGVEEVRKKCDLDATHLLPVGIVERIKEEGRKEERQFILNVLDGIDIADGGCNTKAIRKCLEARYVFRDYGPSFATEAENDWFVSLGAPTKCKQCVLEGNEGVCDRKDCKNYAKNQKEN